MVLIWVLPIHALVFGKMTGEKSLFYFHSSFLLHRMKWLSRIWTSAVSETQLLPRAFFSQLPPRILHLLVRTFFREYYDLLPKKHIVGEKFSVVIAFHSFISSDYALDILGLHSFPFSLLRKFYYYIPTRDPVVIYVKRDYSLLVASRSLCSLINVLI